jgi:hypothetical protein
MPRDIVERLRSLAEVLNIEDADTCHKAADEIERLRAGQREAALSEIAWALAHPDWSREAFEQTPNSGYKQDAESLMERLSAVGLVVVAR